ncbi:unnamed protein product [Ceratitis capitata]|uniref:(Mediterranean fruit fly) hypothetical protein n=1 Tax=Ceratitis capitata TaxID=7213 RepID=A0A811VGX2_CERCA|nr:unnamed protein product [Ceratitis capitata]
MCAHTDRRSALQHTWMPLSDECQKDNKLMCDAVQLIKRAARIATCYANMFIRSMHACAHIQRTLSYRAEHHSRAACLRVAEVYRARVSCRLTCATTTSSSSSTRQPLLVGLWMQRPHRTHNLFTSTRRLPCTLHFIALR